VSGQDPVEFYAGLGSALWERYQSTLVASDLDDAINALDRALAHAGDGHPARSDLLGKRAWLLVARFGLTGDGADLQAASDAYDEAIAIAPDVATRSEHLLSLGTTWWTLYQHYGRDPAALDTAVDIFTRALEGSPKRVAALDALAMCLRHRKGPGDLDRAIDTYAQALEPPSEPEQRARLLDGLGSALAERYQTAGDRDDLDRGVERCREAVELAPEDALYQGNLGAALWERYTAAGQEDDLQQAIDALSAASPSASAAAMLSQALRQRYERHGDRDDLEAAIACARGAIESLEPEAPDAPRLWLGLAAGLSSRHELTGDGGDADESIAAFRRAADLAPDDALSQNNLAVALLNLFHRTGDRQDLEDSIAAARRAADAAPAAGQTRARAINSLGNSLLARFKLLGELDDLDAAIATCEEAVRLVPERSPDRPGFLNNLANGYANRYRWSRSADALVDARSAYGEALELTPSDSPDFPLYMNNWANVVADIYGLTDELKDLEAAIEAYAVAAEATERGSPLRPVRLSNLGVVLWQRYDRTRDRGDLDMSVEAHDEALELAAPSAPERPMWLGEFGRALRSRHEESGDPSDLERGVEALRQSSRGVDVDPSSALGAANTWVSWAIEREAWDEAVEAYHLGIEAARLMLRRQLRRGQKEAWLGRARDLAAQGAVAFASSSDLEQAALALESGRALLLSEALERERAEHEAMLASVPRELAERYLTAAARMSALEVGAAGRL
jgi:tetratricopeptide (TPR) repeat protein